MKLKTLLIAGVSLVAFAGADALAGGHMKAGEKGRHGKHAGKHGKHGQNAGVDGVEGKDGAGSTAGMWKSGFTAGVRGGWLSVKPDRKEKRINGIVGGPIVGYNHFINNLLLGVDAEFEFSSVNKKKSYSDIDTHSGVQSTGKVRYKQPYSWLAHVKAGYAAGRFLPYVKLGVRGSKYKVEVKETFTVPGVGSFTDRDKASKHSIAFAPAVGVDFAVNKKISVGVEGMYTVRKTWKKKTSNGEIEMKPDAWSVKAGVAYRM